MKRITHRLALPALLALATTVAAAEPKDELLAAAKALADKPSYSWTATEVVPEESQFKPGPTEGKVEKGGHVMISQSFGPGTLEIVKKGEKAAMTNQDGGWDSLAEMESDEGFGRFRASMARNLFAPADDVIDLVKHLKEIKKEADAYTGELSEEGAKGLIGFGPRRRTSGEGGPNIPFAKASAKFWVKDGVLSKMEIKAEGSMDFNGNEFEVKRTTTTEIKDVGTTKLTVPEGAAAKLK